MNIIEIKLSHFPVFARKQKRFKFYYLFELFLIFILGYMNVHTHKHTSGETERGP